MEFNLLFVWEELDRFRSLLIVTPIYSTLVVLSSLLWSVHENMSGFLFRVILNTSHLLSFYWYFLRTPYLQCYFNFKWPCGLSVLYVGPCLFLAYFNDLPDSIKGKTKLLADDTIYISRSNPHLMFKPSTMISMSSNNGSETGVHTAIWNWNNIVSTVSVESTNRNSIDHKNNISALVPITIARKYGRGMRTFLFIQCRMV
jgi:hypothetical protein